MTRGNTLQRRARAMKAISVVHAAEMQYVRALRQILSGLHRVFMKGLHLRQDAAHPAKDFHAHLMALDASIASLRKHTGKAFDLMSQRLNKANHAAVTELLGFTPSEQGIVHALAEARERSIGLVETAGRDYAASVRDVFSKPENFGKRWEELRDDLEERGDVSGSRAELIARDQVLRVNSELNETRQGNAGVEEYEWSTSRDERVAGDPEGKYPKALPSHYAREGQRFRWDTPPSEDEMDGHPGQNRPQCRCVAIPVIPGVDD